jgi:hypothetical protein
MASKALHAVRRRSILWCWMDMQGDESNPAPPRPDPLTRIIHERLRKLLRERAISLAQDAPGQM